VQLPRYSSLLVPAAAGSYSVEPVEPSGRPVRILTGAIPRSQAETRTELQTRGFSAGEIDVFLAQFTPAKDLGHAAVRQE
jgi:hypothetical protein